MAIGMSIVGAIVGALGVFIVMAATPVGFAVCEHGCSLGVFFLVGAGLGAAVGGVIGAAAEGFGSWKGTADLTNQDRGR